MEKIDVVIIGAGVVGLAIASRLVKHYENIFVIEKEPSFGQGASSRNSEIIHAGIYYHSDSLKAKTCVEGNRMLYEICQNNKIPFKKLGKLIVSTNSDEDKQIDVFYTQGNTNGVVGLEIIDSAKIKELEPNIEGIRALFSPETGVVDSHKLMEYFYLKAKEEGAGIVYQSKVKSIHRQSGFYQMEIEDSHQELFKFSSKIVVNAAGLYSDLIAAMVGINIKKEEYDLKYCKGQYFRLSPDKSRLINRLVYPVPDQSDGGLGIHLTPDISGQVKLGPDAQYLPENVEDYEVDKDRQQQFCDSINKFAPFIKLDDIYPDMAGIRSKLQGPNEDFRDFVIQEESDKGFPGFINLIGIESPGLTCAVSIAKYVENLLKLQ